MNPKNRPSLRWRTPRALALFGLMALIAVVIVLAFTQTSTVAAPPPPLRGPFRFVELPKEMSAAVASTAVFSWTPFYTQTFDTALASWTLTRSVAFYPAAASLRWDRVLESLYPGQVFTNTLWSGAYSDDRTVNKVVFPDPTQYTQTMDTWAIYGPLDRQKYAHLRAEFDFYLDAGPGAYFGWGASNDGQTFCGKLGSATTGSRIQQWQHMTFDLTECSAGAGTPVYLAFFFQSSDTTPPAGLGAFVDNLVISGIPWNKIYLPLVSNEPTVTPAASPTPTAEPYPLTQSYDFESLGRWCSNDNDSWASGLTSLKGRNVYYLALKKNPYLWALSPRDSSTPNFRITADFSLLGTNNLSLYNYRGDRFGLLFSVKGNPFDYSNPCTYNGGYADSGIGYYRFIIRINNAGSGYQTLLTRWENGVEPEQNGSFVDLPAGVTIDRTGWNTMRIDRYGANIKAYINDTLVQDWNNSNTTGGWFGLFTEIPELPGGTSSYFESDWDNIKVYNLNP